MSQQPDSDLRALVAKWQQAMRELDQHAGAPIAVGQFNAYWDRHNALYKVYREASDALLAVEIPPPAEDEPIKPEAWR